MDSIFEGVALRTIQAAYRRSLRPARRRFERALSACGATQRARLARLVKENRDTAYGRANGFAAITSPRSWQDRVPVVGYDELEPWVARAAAGQARVLTAQPIRLFERTSGSTAANKLIPYTDDLLAEFSAATDPWLHDLYTSLPGLAGTTGYWSISPATRGREKTAGGHPIGFADDTEYFGPFARFALRRMLAVPPEVARLPDMESWSAATIAHLAAAENLGLISVWHPSFFLLLLRRIEQDLDAVLALLSPRRRQDVAARLGVGTLGQALWPRLALVSCWADAAAAGAVPALRKALPHAHFQGKGLLATEGVISVPLLAAGGDAPVGSGFVGLLAPSGAFGSGQSLRGERNHYPPVAAVAGHFLEFIDVEHPARRPRLADELESGAAYQPVISTGGGFYRYRLGDVVRVEGFYAQAPRLRFVGRLDSRSDLCGEKLDAHRVAAAIERAERASAVELSFSLLAPTAGDPPHYRLYADGAEETVLRAVAATLEGVLGESDAYAYARALGQLGPLEPVLVPDGAARYLTARIAAGARAGDVKPSHLDARLDWGAVFCGSGGAAGDGPEGAPLR